MALTGHAPIQLSVQEGGKGSSFFGGSAIYVVSNVIAAAIPFLLLPVLTRYLTPGEYGEIAMFQTLVGALGAVIGLGTAGAVSRKYFDKGTTEETLRDFVAACLQILLLSSFLVFVAAFILRDRISSWFNLDVGWVLWAVLVATLAVPTQLRLGQWEMRRKARQYGVMQTSQSIANMGLSLFLVVILLKGADGRITAQIVTAGGMAGAALFLLRRDRLFSFFSWRPEYIKEALAFGVPLVPHLAGAFILVAVDRLLVGKELGLEHAGVYMVAVQLAGALLMVFDAVARAFSPWLFEQLNSGDAVARRQVVKRIYVLFTFMLAAGIVAFATGGWFVELIAGSRYARAGEVIGWLALGQVFFGMYLILNGFMVYAKRTGIVSWITIFSGLAGILLLIVGIKLGGLQGAGVAFCITMALRTAATWWAAQHCQAMPWLGSKETHNV